MVYKCILFFDICIEHIASNCLFEAIHINSSKCKLFRGVFMIIKAFKMKIYDGMADEYQKRHNELWPEMKEMIHNYGGSNYSIFFDKDTNILFGYIELKDEELWDKSRDTEVCRKWWDFMADIMETNLDNSPVSILLKEVFHLN